MATRRDFLSQAALALAGTAGWNVFGAHRALANAPLRVTESGPGSATAVWQPLLDSGAASQPKDLQLEWVKSTPGQVQMQLIAGTANVAVYGALGVAEIAPRGADIVIFGPALNNHGRWIVRDNSSYRTPKDLFGKTIATLHEGSDTYRHARLAASLQGIELKRDYKIVHGAPTANVALFERGDVDAVITIEPTATRLVARGAREILRVEDQWREATGNQASLFLVGLAAHREWAERNRTAISRYANVILDLHRHIAARPERLAEHHRAYGIPDSERAAIELLPTRLKDIYAVEWGSSVFANIDQQIDAAVKAGILPAKPAKPVYDPTLAASG